MEALIVFGILAIFVGIVVAVVLFNMKRYEGLKAIAQDLKLQFFPKGHDSIQPYLANFDLFTIGRNQRIRNLMLGKVKASRGTEVSVAIFDYCYSTGARRDPETYCQSVILLYDPSLHVPRFSLREEGLFDKVANQFGFKDINFPEFPKFSKHYRLNADNEVAVRQVFQPNLIKFYEGQQDRHRICTEATSSYVMIFPFSNPNSNHQSFAKYGTKHHGNSRFLMPNEVKPFLDNGLRLLTLLSANTQ